MPANLAIHRLSARTPARAEAVAARLALQALGADLEDALPRGLPPQALLWLRRLQLQAPEAALLRPASAGLRQGWIAAGRERLDAALAQAVRPALGPVPESAPAVLFADAAEMLACLALAAQAGQLDRWWWRGLLGRAWPQWQSAWAARPEAQAGAQRLLARLGPGRAPMRVMGEPAVQPAPAAGAAVVAGLPTDAGAAVVPADAERTAPPALFQAAVTANPQRFRVRTGHDESQAPAAALEPASQQRAVDVVAATPPTRMAVPSSPAVSPALSKPAGERSASPRVARVESGAPSARTSPAAKPARRRRAGPSAPLPASSDVPAQPLSSVRVQAAEVSAAAPPAPHAKVPPDTPAVLADALRQMPSAVSPPAVDSTPPLQPQGPQGPRETDLAARADEPIAWPWPEAVFSRQAPLLFIVNALLEDGLYPDFTRPRDPGLPVPLWALLAALARAWRLPDDTLPAVLQAHSSDWIAPATMPAAPGAAAGPWLQWLAAYSRSLRRRLCRRLGLRTAAWPHALTLAQPARLWLTESEWVAEFDLAAHDVAWRLAGLDRDPGWLPSAGCSLRFTFG